MPDIAAIAISLPAVPVPPDADALIGYGGTARYVGCHGDRAAGLVRTFDGRGERCGYEWIAWLCFLEHDQVWPHIETFAVQGNGNAAGHWLLLDRFARCWYVAPAEVARRWLAAQVDL